jgi:virginiamycin A acetyltransferase
VTVAPDPDRLHPVTGQERVVFLKALVTDPKIQVGEYTYYDDPDDPVGFERRAVLYAYGPERLIIGRYCAVASGVRFIMPGATTRSWGTTSGSATAHCRE